MSMARRDEWARRLAAIGRGLTYARSLDEMLEMAIDCAIDLLGADRVAVLVTDPAGKLRVRASRGIDDGSAARFGEPLDESLLDKLTTLFADQRDRFLGVPLVVEGAVIGLLAVCRTHDPLDDVDEEWLLSALADQTSLAVETTHSRELRRELQGRLGQLEQERKAKDHALEVLSHDLRSPLNALQGYTSLLSGEILGPVNDRQQDALRKMRLINEHLASMLGNVLDMAKLASGTATVSIVETNLADVVAEAIDIVRPAAERARIALESRADGPATIETDPSRLRQVITQLLENAVKYAPDGTTITVEERVLPDGWLEVSVADEGPGVPAELHDRIFEPYVRQDGGEARGHAGVGLGLAIGRTIVEHLGGTLTLDPPGDTGATFRIRLPARPARRAGERA